MLFHELFVGGTLARQWRNQWKTVVFCHLLSWKICVFQNNLVGGAPRKLLEKHEKTMLFHEVFVGGTFLGKQWSNQRKTVAFATFFHGKFCVFQYNAVRGALGKLPENHGKTCFFMYCLHSKTMEKSTAPHFPKVLLRRVE